MTLTELKYIVAVARERHFGRAAEACAISQPTLSVAVKKLEEELDVKLFERASGEVAVTPIGAEIVRQAQSVLEQAGEIHEIARRGKDPLAGPLKLGVIYTIAPYLLPALVRENIARTPQMPLVLHESFTVRLLEMLRTGEIDCAILAEPFESAGLATAALYDEPFVAALPAGHPLAGRASLTSHELRSQTLLLLGAGHCFRDHVLEVCPEYGRLAGGAADGIGKRFEGSSLETILHMVAAGMGVTLVPRLAVPAGALGRADADVPTAEPARAHPSAGPASHSEIESIQPSSGARWRPESPLIAYVPVHDAGGAEPPTRRVVLAWRRSFPRYEAIAALRNAIHPLPLEGVVRLT